jgi:hypothetical protein
MTSMGHGLPAMMPVRSDSFRPAKDSSSELGDEHRRHAVQ